MAPGDGGTAAGQAAGGRLTRRRPVQCTAESGSLPVDLPAHRCDETLVCEQDHKVAQR